MDRDAFIAGLRLPTIRPIDLVSFYRGLPRRVPAGSSDEHEAARGAIEAELATLNARTLGREPDLRVPVDVEEVSHQIADRLERFTSADWARGNPTSLDAARQTLAAILAEIRVATGAVVAEESGGEDEDPD